MKVNRRKFLSLSAMASAAAFTRAEAWPQATLAPAAPGYELLIFATNWGYEGSWADFAARIRKAGYDGAEVWYPSDEQDRKEFLAAFQQHQLRYGLLVGGSDRDPAKHLEQFTHSLRGAVNMKPVYINCHSGRDYFSFEQNKPFIEATTQASAASGIPIYHETHRSRILYSAPVARHYMEQLPALQLTLDISHWCCVHESLLADQEDTVALALQRTGHIHTRVGHAEGPQVNDPRAPEWKAAMDTHLRWWDTVVSKKRAEGKRMTMLTEFGPVDYLPALPYTRQPVADQWDINVHMLNLLRQRYQP
ncbi:MAG: TIM barrel protein [Cyclobacteriaceae bacterium]|mgnify:CR=1 FL=1